MSGLGSIALLRFLSQSDVRAPFHAGWRPWSLRVRFGDLVAARAMSSYVCCALTLVIPDASFLRHEWHVERLPPALRQQCEPPPAGSAGATVSVVTRSSALGGP